MTPCQILLKQEGSMQQSSATPKNQDVGRGLRKIVACSQSSSQCLFVSVVFNSCFTHFFSHNYDQDTVVGSLASLAVRAVIASPRRWRGHTTARAP